ncbi:hypothetical protein A4X09_0g3232 [Tilletia walkeri]|uniref:Galactose oxidase n=1 Tax=Tilletia walkeri TaxID=117179 RepID=A0A8X7NB01_9BASI|nr:hypothetical protein A4X09_0g3232 [Tilletia walkeri]
MTSSTPAAAAPTLRARALPCHFVPSLTTLAAYPISLSSHALAIDPTSNQAYLFGGEFKPRQPVGDELRVIRDLNSANPEDSEATDVLTRPREAEEGVAWPAPRVGASLTACGNGYVWLWGGRGGKDMAPLGGEEETSIWRFSVGEKSWERFETTGERPMPRSYHSATVAAGKLYVHAGCPESGRLSTLHALDLKTCRWQALADAPGPQRGGTVIAAIPSPFTDSKETTVLARWGGFCGEELGGPLDIYDPTKDSWTSYPAPLSSDGDKEPPKRSVHGLVPFPTAPTLEVEERGEKVTKRVLGVLFFGEGEGAPKELGHDGAGKFLADTYLLTASHPPTPDTPSFTFTAISLQPASSFTKTPEPRGWFAFDAVSTGERSLQIVIHGGLNEGNDRLSDAWSLDLRV